MRANQRLTEYFTVTSADGTTHEIDLGIVGHNTRAIVAGVSSGLVREDAGIAANGKLSIIDPDAGQAHFVPTDQDATYGHLTLAEDGAWTYRLDDSNPRVQSLPAGATVTDRILVGTVDGTPQMITIAIIGTNDAGRIGGTSQGTVYEDVQTRATGILTVDDADRGQNQFLPCDIHGAYGTLHLQADGSWDYALADGQANVQSLGKGRTAVDSLTVHAIDGTSHVVTITVTGSNDAATITGTDAAAVVEDNGVIAGSLTTTGQLTVTDTDTGEQSFVAMNQARGVGGYGSFTLAADGHWTYTADAGSQAIQALNEGKVVADEITVRSLDGTQHTLRVTLTGTGDLPVIAGTATGTVHEDATAPLSGTLIITDADADEGHFVAGDVAGTHGTLHLDAGGSWTYTLDSTGMDVQNLGQGVTLTDTLTVHAADGTAVQVAVTIVGTEDAPTVTALTAAPADLGVVTEDTSRTFTQTELLGLVGASDIDASDRLSITDVSLDPAIGSFARLSDGSWRLTPTANTHHDDIAATLSVSDGHVTTLAHGVIDVTPATDVPSPALAVSARQQVMQFGGPHENAPGAIVTSDPIHAGHGMTGMSVEMTFIAGTQVATAGIHGATFFSYATPNNPDESYLWNPDNITFRVGGHEYETGVSMPNDGHDHRVGVIWSNHGGTLDLMIDGQVAKHMTGVGQGVTIPDGGKLMIGNDQDTFGGGIAANDGFHGKMFGAAFASAAIDPSRLQDRALADLLRGDPTLIADIRTDTATSHFTDLTGHNRLLVLGDVSVATVDVDTAIATPNPGAELRLAAQWTPSADQDDHLVHAWLHGLPQGTVLSDSHGHQTTIAAGQTEIDVLDWNHATMVAQTPSGHHDNFRLDLTLVAQGPDGVEAVASTSSPVVFDRSQPVPPENVQHDVGSDDAESVVLHLDSDIGAGHEISAGAQALLDHVGTPGHDAAHPSSSLDDALTSLGDGSLHELPAAHHPAPPPPPQQLQEELVSLHGQAHLEQLGPAALMHPGRHDYTDLVDDGHGVQHSHHDLPLLDQA
jgi:VCBS repeat-containing protein